MDLKLECVPLPVADVDRAKAFYSERLGFAVDVDHSSGPDFRVVQLTPPGSACSVMVGVGIVDTAPGSVHGLHLVVADIVAVRDDLVSRGVDVAAVRHMTPQGFVEGVDPAHADYNSFAEFTDPDGNSWVLQERGHG
jgi:catechol 2,3-dioxygenase-like lactoylglutathione lyase family enzyme